MDQVQTRLQIAELLAQNESVLGELYRSYAALLPAQAEAWNGLAEEEELHAAWLRRLLPKLEAGTVTFEPARFKPRAIENSIASVRERLAAAGAKTPTEREALGTALELERSLLENGYFTILEADAEELRRTFEQLTRSTRNHLHYVQSLLVMLP